LDPASVTTSFREQMFASEVLYRTAGKLRKEIVITRRNCKEKRKDIY
jgi:hypothetical protein